MILQELFDQKLQSSNIEYENNTCLDARKTIGGIPINFYADAVNGIWTVEFSADVPGKDKYALTGTRNEVQVLSFVMSCLKHLIQKHEPEAIKFTSNKSDGSRTSLYKRMTSYFKDQYDVEVSDAGKNDRFIMKRHEAQEQTLKDGERRTSDFL